MKFNIKKATKEKSKLRLALHGPSGSGKTYSALNIATEMAMGGRVILTDTERGSARKYADKFAFDVLEMEGHCDPKQLPEMLTHYVSEGYVVAIIDSLTHFWNGPGGFLEQVDDEVKKMKAKGQKPDSFAAWKVVDPVYKSMVHALLSSPIHIIMTMRAKMEYSREEGANGRTKITKVGLAPEMRDQFSYEADIEGMLDIDHNLVIGKTRCDAIDGKVFTKPGKEFAHILLNWLEDGAQPAPPPPNPVQQIVADASKVEDPKAFDGLKERAKAVYKNASDSERQALDRAIKDAKEVLGARLAGETAQAAS